MSGMRALIDLALAVEEGEKVREGVSETVKKALEKHRMEREEAASNDIVALLRRIEAHKLGSRAQIRRLKAELKKITSGLNDLDRCWEYAQSTNNFIPVLAFFGEVSASDLADPSSFESLSAVPADWGKGEE